MAAVAERWFDRHVWLPMRNALSGGRSGESGD